ncbi:MAG: DNA polymerase I [Desulfamplus sp.]|nr:DNA polymerase I [Desulfamplus sp.]
MSDWRCLKMKKPKIYLIDGSAYIYRAFHAIPHLSNSKGLPTNAAFGVTTMLLKLIKEHQPVYAAIFFDVKGETFRHKLYEQYKANRSAMPDELIQQIPYIKEIVKAFNIPIIEKEGFEADDLIGTYSRIAKEYGWDIVIVTGDKDFMQLVNDNCVIWDPMKDKVINRDVIKNEFQIEPEQVIDMFGLAGDSSDNVPGVQGVGPKTAIKLISEFGSIQAIYDAINANQIESDNRNKVESDNTNRVESKKSNSTNQHSSSIIEKVKSLKSKKSLYKNLTENREMALLSRSLVTINQFVDVSKFYDIINLELKPYDNQKLTEIFKKLEFRKLHQEFFEANKEQIEVKKDYICLTDIRDIENLVKEIVKLQEICRVDEIGSSNKIDALYNTENSLENKKNGDFIFAIDTETTSVNPMLAELVGISISFKPHQAFYIPVGHLNPSSSTPDLFGQSIKPEKEFVQPNKEAVLNILKPILENPLIEKVGQNIKYDYIVFAKNGIYMQGIVFDTMIASYLLNPSGRGHGLDQIALDLLGHKNITYKEVTTPNFQSDQSDLIQTDSKQADLKKRESGKSRAKQLIFNEVSIEKATDYACEDADITLLAYNILRKKIDENYLDNLMQTIEMPLIPVLANMEMNGIKVDREKLQTLSKGFEQELEKIEKEIFEIAGETFNINSSQQLGYILFEKLKLPTQKKTKKKSGYSTDIAVLTELATQHALPEMVLRYRSIGKLKSTYTDALQELIHPQTGRIHTSFNQAITATGRLSSSDPNLQNIPIRTEEGRRIREAFIPEKGCKIVSADYSQIELRILAHFADDKILIDAFQNDEDIHARTAAEVFNAIPELIDDELRRQAKAINFGIVYGMGAFKLSNELSISRKMAQTYIDNYFSRYSGVKRYIDNTIEKAKESGEVITIFGRKRRLDDIHSSNANIRGVAERMAINTPIQGSAADIIKLAMIKMDKALKENILNNGKKMAAKMLLSVHDEILFEVPEDELEELKIVAKEVMESVRVVEGMFELKVPLKVNIDSGDNWAKAH